MPVNERPRVTLAAPSAVFTGVGLHSGADAALCLLPALPGAGLIFRVKATGQEIPARAANVTDTSRCTRLAANGVEVQTVEHVLSALAGLGVDDAVIEIDGGEVPAGDGSALPFVTLIRAAGLRRLDTTVCPMILDRPVMVTEGGSTIVVMPAEKFQATVVLDYPKHPAIGTQGLTFDPAAEDYEKAIAPARTFGFLSEIEALRAHGLGLGASYDNAVVLDDHGRCLNPPRFPDELTRHKLLDLIGDLALIGQPLQAHIMAMKPGHALNTRLARLLSLKYVEECP